jgi:pilus assembly protein CpaB
MADEVNSVSGMLRPGDRIDLLFTARDTLSAEQGGVGDLTRPLLQDVRILATGSQLDSTQPRGPGASSFGTITVEVSPDQAQQLVLAQRGGRLTALLRGPDDRHEIGTGSLDLAALLGRVRPARSPVPPAPVQRPAMEIIVGGIGRTPPAVAVPALAAPAAVAPAAAVPAIAVPVVAVPADAPQAPGMRSSDSKPASPQPAPFHRVDEANGSGMFPVAAQPHLIR